MKWAVAVLVSVALCAQTKKINDLVARSIKGDPGASYQLALIYRDGEGVDPDSKVAMSYFRLAAEKGYAPAQFAMGDDCLKAKGYFQDKPYDIKDSKAPVIQPDYPKAMEWFRLSADQDYGPSQFMVGALYAEGLGVPQDIVEAYAWLSIAASKGLDYAKGARDNIAKQLEPDALVKAQERSKVIFAEIAKKRP